MSLDRSILYILAAMATIAAPGDLGRFCQAQAASNLAPGESNEPYGSPDTSKWFRNALAWDASPVDLSFLNRDDRPAGRHGFVKADGDHFVFQDGTPVRFWGAQPGRLRLVLHPSTKHRQASAPHGPARL